MERISLATYAIDVLEPLVADVLYQLSGRFTCRDIWQGSLLGRFDGRRVEARPLLDEYNLRGQIDQESRVYSLYDLNYNNVKLKVVIIAR